MSGFVTGLRREQRQVPLFTGVIAGVARAIRDPRIAGVLRAGPRVVDFLVRSHRRTAGIADDDSIVKVRPTPVAGRPGVSRRSPDRRPSAPGPAAQGRGLRPGRRRPGRRSRGLRGPGVDRRPRDLPPRPPAARRRTGGPRGRSRTGLRAHHLLERVGAASRGARPDAVARAPGQPDGARLGVEGPGAGPRVLAGLPPRVRHGATRVDGPALVSHDPAAPDGHTRCGSGAATARTEGLGTGAGRGSHDHRHGRQHARHGPGDLGRAAPHRLAAGSPRVPSGWG